MVFSRQDLCGWMDGWMDNGRWDGALRDAREGVRLGGVWGARLLQGARGPPQPAAHCAWATLCKQFLG